MEKLKTFKDLREDVFNNLLDDDALISLDSVKDEAIKWIKELMKDESICWKEGFHPFADFRHDTSPIIDFLKDRFNITEEDLK